MQKNVEWNKNVTAFFKMAFEAISFNFYNETD